MAFSPDAGGFKDQQRDESFELKKNQFVGWFNTQNSMSLSEYVMTLNLWCLWPGPPAIKCYKMLLSQQKGCPMPNSLEGEAPQL